MPRSVWCTMVCRVSVNFSPKALFKFFPIMVTLLNLLVWVDMQASSSEDVTPLLYSLPSLIWLEDWLLQGFWNSGLMRFSGAVPEKSLNIPLVSSLNPWLMSSSCSLKRKSFTCWRYSFFSCVRGVSKSNKKKPPNGLCDTTSDILSLANQTHRLPLRALNALRPKNLYANCSSPSNEIKFYLQVSFKTLISCAWTYLHWASNQYLYPKHSLFFQRAWISVDFKPKTRQIVRSCYRLSPSVLQKSLLIVLEFLSKWLLNQNLYLCKVLSILPEYSTACVCQASNQKSLKNCSLLQLAISNCASNQMLLMQCVVLRSFECACLNSCELPTKLALLIQTLQVTSYMKAFPIVSCAVATEATDARYFWCCKHLSRIQKLPEG